MSEQNIRNAMETSLGELFQKTLMVVPSRPFLSLVTGLRGALSKGDLEECRERIETLEAAVRYYNRVDPQLRVIPTARYLGLVPQEPFLSPLLVLPYYDMLHTVTDLRSAIRSEDLERLMERTDHVIGRMARSRLTQSNTRMRSIGNRGGVPLERTQYACVYGESVCTAPYGRKCADCHLRDLTCPVFVEDLEYRNRLVVERRIGGPWIPVPPGQCEACDPQLAMKARFQAGTDQAAEDLAFRLESGGAMEDYALIAEDDDGRLLALQFAGREERNRVPIVFSCRHLCRTVGEVQMDTLLAANRDRTLSNRLASWFYRLWTEALEGNTPFSRAVRLFRYGARKD